MNKFTAYIYLIFFTKIIFILMSLIHIFLKLKGKENSELDKKFVYVKERVEFIFVFLMAFLLIYLFNPFTSIKTVEVNGKPKILLYLFGIVLLITADWNTFIYESQWFKSIQQIIGKSE
jgi:hypothetical protein